MTSTNPSVPAASAVPPAPVPGADAPSASGSPIGQAPAASAVPPAPLEQSLNTTLKTAPELKNSPGLAVGVASSGGDTTARAQGVARITSAVTDAQAKQNVEVSAGGGISGALNWIGNSVAHVVSDYTAPIEQGGKDLLGAAGKILGAQMQYVQHEYRYLHDVEARHGQLAAVLEGIGLAAGAAAGFAGTGTISGAELGAEAAGSLEGQFFYKDSWDRTTSGSYTDPHTHQSVSIGRDIAASVLGLAPGTLTFKIGSGLIDGIADMQVGGNEELGLIGKARSETGLASNLPDWVPGAGIRNTLGDYFPGVSAATAEDFENSYLHYGQVQNAMKDIAGKDAGEIAMTPAYQTLKITPLASTAKEDVMSTNDFIKALGETTTADEAAGVFRDALRTHELVGMDTIPTLSYTRVPFQALREWAEGAHGVNLNTGNGILADEAPSTNLALRVARNFIRLPSAADDNGAVSMKVFDPSSQTDNGAVGLGRLLMYTENRRTAASVVNDYINANLSGRILIYRNAVMNVLQAKAAELGGFQSADMGAIKKAIDDFTGGAEPGAEGWMGMDDQGRNLSPVADTAEENRQYCAALLDNQTGKLRWVDLSTMNQAARSLTGYRGLFGKVAKADDFLYRNITQEIFKPMVLLTPSYAMHIALAELIPNALRLGVFNLAKAGISINAAKLGSNKLESDAATSALDSASRAYEAVRFSGDTERIAAAEQRLNTAASRVDDAQLSAISGLAWRLVGLHRATTAADIIAANPDSLSRMGQRIQLASRYIDLMGGDTVSKGLSSGHNYSQEVDRATRSEGIIRTSIANTPVMTDRNGNTFAKFGNDSEHFMNKWQEWLNMVGKDEKSQIAANRLAASLRAGLPLEDAHGPSATQDAVAAVSSWLRQQPDSYLDKYIRSKDSITSLSGDDPTHFAVSDRPLGRDQFDDWAADIVANVRGATRAANQGEMNLNLLDKLGAGEQIHQGELLSMPQRLRPQNVIGREVSPAAPTNLIRRVANAGFEQVLNPMVNFLSRQPIAFAEFEKQYAKELPLVASGLKTDDEAMVNALTKTTNIVIRNIHNLADRTQWTVALRNWAPFFFAQEQAYRRMGRLLAENPTAFRKYQLMISNVHDVGQVLGGPDGKSYFVLPHTGWLTPSFINNASRYFPITGSSPVGMGWNLNSMSVIFPVSDGIRPDLGPVAAVPMQAISGFFPEMLSTLHINAPSLVADTTGLETALTGQGASQPLWEQLVPNTILARLLEAVNGAEWFDDRSLGSTVMQATANMDYEGLLPHGPTADTTAAQQAADRIRGQARVWMVMKALIGAITPISPEIQPSGQNFRSEYDADAEAWTLATTKGAVVPGQTDAQALTAAGFSMNQLGFPKELHNDIASTGSLSKGIQEYLRKHPDATAKSVFLQVNPDGTPFTEAESGSASGAYLNASVQAENWLNSTPVANLIHNGNYNKAIFYLMPQLTDTKYNSAIYNEQLTQHFRTRYPLESSDPSAMNTYINQLYVAQGNAQFFGNGNNDPKSLYGKYQASLTGATPAQKYTADSSFYAADGPLAQFMKANPIWAQWWTAGSANPAGLNQQRSQVVEQLQDMFRKNLEPPSPMNGPIKDLLNKYGQYVSSLTSGATNNWIGQTQSELKAGWTQTLQAEVQQHPELSTFVNAVFQTLPTPGTTP